MTDNNIDFKSDYAGKSARFGVHTFDANKGTYRIVNHQKKELACEGGDSMKIVSWGGEHKLKEFQFIPKDGGFAIYNPFTQKFVSPREDGIAGCLFQEYDVAMSFVGINLPMTDKYRLRSTPSLFTTKLTAKG